MRRRKQRALNYRPAHSSKRRQEMFRAVGVAAFVVFASPMDVSAAPSAETARKCVHYSYIAFPYKRPGAVRMSGDRQAYFKDCVAKDGNVPAPAAVKEQ
jgi:hypothetical protein